MRVLLIGPPASGKGTQGTRVAERFGVRYLSSGALLREAIAEGGETGRRVAAFVERGDLVPDDVIIGLLRRPLADAVRARGYVLDGFPRTLVQAKAAYDLGVELGATLQAVLFLDVGEEELLRRMRLRAGVEGRSDDTDDIMGRRLAVYRERTEPLLEYYGARGVLHRIDARGSVDDVSAAIFEVLDRIAAAEPA